MNFEKGAAARLNCRAVARPCSAVCARPRSGVLTVRARSLAACSCLLARCAAVRGALLTLLAQRWWQVPCAARDWAPSVALRNPSFEGRQTSLSAVRRQGSDAAGGSDDDSELRRRLAAAEQLAADEASKRKAAEEIAKESTRLLAAELSLKGATSQADKWANAATRASLLPDAEKEILRLDEGAVFGDIPPLPAEVVSELVAVVPQLTELPDDAPEKDAYTNGSVHSVALSLLLAIERCARPACQLRRFYEQPQNARNTPDFTYTGRHEATVTPLSSLISLELKPIKTKGKSRKTLLAEGKVQGFRYGAARVLQLRARFPDATRWEAMVVVSNMRTLCVMRVVFTDDAFVVYTTADEPLLPPQPPPPAASGGGSLPRGVELLARVLRASPSQLGGMFCSPPDQIQVVPSGRGKSLIAETVAIGNLLGSGGYCDVFAGTWRDIDVAVKLPRSPKDKQSISALRSEETALRKLARTANKSPHVPTLNCAAVATGSAQLALVMQPVGVVATAAPGSAAAPGSPERCALAHACAVGVFDALRTAHAASVVHRDVRPTNVLWHEPTRCAVLIDWGIARVKKQDSLRALQPAALGWPDAAPNAALRATMHAGPPWMPCAATDCESAVYTLAAIAFGEPCGHPPWASSSEADASDVALAAAAAAASAVARGRSAVKSAVTSAVVAARLKARDDWFASLPQAHPLRLARAQAQAAQVQPRTKPPYALPPGWSELP